MYDLAHADSRAAFDQLRYDLDRDVQKWTALVGIPVFGLVVLAYFQAAIHFPVVDELGRAPAAVMWIVCLVLYFAIQRGLVMLWRRRAPNLLELSMADIERLEAAVAASPAAER